MTDVSQKTGDELLRLCSSAKDVVIAAPYIKKNALKVVLSSTKSIDSLTCITKWQPDDIIFGASDINCRALVRKQGGSFKLHPSLHAKYFRMDDVVLIGSANLTKSAMGWSKRPNLEILCHASEEFNSYEFEQGLLRDSREISDDEYKYWKTIDSIRKTSDQDVIYFKPLANTWMPFTRDPNNLILAYQGQIENIAHTDEQLATQRDLDNLAFPEDMAIKSLKAWISVCLLASPFTNSVIQLTELPEVDNFLAKKYDLSITEARRKKETVHNWLSFLQIGW